MCQSAGEQIYVLAFAQGRLEAVMKGILPRSEATLSGEILWQENVLQGSSFEGTLTFRGCCWTSSLWAVAESVIWASLPADLTVGCSLHLSQQAQERIFWRVVVVIDLCLCCSSYWSRQVQTRTFWQAVETVVTPENSFYLSQRALD